MPHLIVIPDDDPPLYHAVQHPDLQRLAEAGEVRYYGVRSADASELLDRLRAADALINVRSFTRFDRSVLSALPHLRILSVLGTGTDNVDLAAATEQGIVVTNTPGVSSVSVAEHAFGLLLAVTRRIVLGDRRIREGQWYHEAGPELYGKTLGIIGLGSIGKEMARLGRGFGMRVIGWSFHPDATWARAAGVELAPFDDIFRQADAVSLHLRGTPEATGIVGDPQLRLMRPTAYLVNTARGSLIADDALVAALRQRRIAGAGLDVYTSEPLPADSPFLTIDNVVLCPHSGAVTLEAQARLAQLPVDNILAAFAGRPQNVVNPASLAALEGPPSSSASHAPNSAHDPLS